MQIASTRILINLFSPASPVQLQAKRENEINLFADYIHRRVAYKLSLIENCFLVSRSIDFLNETATAEKVSIASQFPTKNFLPQPKLDRWRDVNQLQ